MKSRKPKKTNYPKVTTRIKICGNCGEKGHNRRGCKKAWDEAVTKVGGDSMIRTFTSGTVSTKQPRLSLLFHRGLINAAETCELGIERHGEKALNGLSNNTTPFTDKAFLIERCSHVIEHCYLIIDRLKVTDELANLDDIALCARDAGAIAWGGLMLGEAAKRNLNGK